MNQQVIEATRAFSKNAIVFETSHMVAIRDNEGLLHIVRCIPEPALEGQTMTRKEWNEYDIQPVKNQKPIRSILQAKEV